MIKRTLINEIPKLLSFFPVLGLIGPRQVGKTTLVKVLSEQLPKPILYLDLENLNDYTLLEKDPQWFLEQQTDKIVVIDEVQRMLSLFPLLRSLIDQKPEGGRFILLGSAESKYSTNTFHLYSLFDWSCSGGKCSVDTTNSISILPLTK